MPHTLWVQWRMTERDLQQQDEAAYRATQFIGKRGVEAYYEDELHGRPGFQQVETDAMAGSAKSLILIRPRCAKISPCTWTLAYSKLPWTRWGATQAIAVTDPKTGGVLALGAQLRS